MFVFDTLQKRMLGWGDWNYHERKLYNYLSCVLCVLYVRDHVDIMQYHTSAVAFGKLEQILCPTSSLVAYLIGQRTASRYACPPSWECLSVSWWYTTLLISHKSLTFTKFHECFHGPFQHKNNEKLRRGMGMGLLTLIWKKWAFSHIIQLWKLHWAVIHSLYTQEVRCTCTWHLEHIKTQMGQNS